MAGNDRIIQPGDQFLGHDINRIVTAGVRAVAIAEIDAQVNVRFHALLQWTAQLERAHATRVIGDYVHALAVHLPLVFIDSPGEHG